MVCRNLCARCNLTEINDADFIIVSFAAIQSRLAVSAVPCKFSGKNP